MKKWLRISVGLNMALAVGLACVWLTRTPPGPVPSATPSAAPMAKVMPTQVETNPSVAELKPFRWSQLDAKDYHDYVKNLRAIGCPESALQAIVTADVHAVFRLYRQELEKQLSDLSAASWSAHLANPNAEQMLKSRQQQLPTEELAQINNYLGKKPSEMVSPASLAASDGLIPQGGSPLNGNSVALCASTLSSNGVYSASSPASSVTEGFAPALGRSRVLTGTPKPVAMPLAFQASEELAEGLNESQMQIVTDLRQKFMKNVGSSGLNPNDPAYLKLWQAQQDALDRLLFAQLGAEGYFNYQMSLHPFPAQ